MSSTKTKKGGKTTPAKSQAKPARPKKPEVNPVEAARGRESAYERMTPKARQLADRYFSRLGRNDVEHVMAMYDLGHEVPRVESAEKAYGEDALALIAKYLDVEGGVNGMSGLRRWATAFDRTTVKDYTSFDLPRGRHMSVLHWSHLASVNSSAQRQRFLEMTVSNGWSARELKANIAGTGAALASPRTGGGRNQKKVTSVAEGIEKTRKTLTSLNKWAQSDAYDDYAGMLKHHPVEQVHGALVQKVKGVLDQIGHAKLAIEKIENDHRQRLLVWEEAGRAAAAEPPAAAAPASAPATPPAPVAGVNGHGRHTPARPAGGPAGRVRSNHARKRLTAA